MHMENTEATFRAAARDAERDRIVWPHYCRKISPKMSVTRESCLERYMAAQASKDGPCFTCPTGRGLLIEHMATGKKAPTSPNVQKRPENRVFTSTQGQGRKEDKTTPAAKPGRVAGVSADAPEQQKPEPEWMPSAEELKAAGVGPEVGEVEGDPFAGLEFEAAPDKRIQPAVEVPQISLRKCGEVYLNQHAAEKLGDTQYAKLLFAPRARVLGVQPVGERVPGSVKLRMDSKRSKNGICMSGSGPLKAWGILPAKAISLPAEWSEAHGMWCVRLPEAKS